MKVIEINWKIIYLRKILIACVPICTLISIFTNQEESMDLTFFYIALLMLFLWNVIRIFIKPYSIICKLDLKNGNDFIAVSINDIQKIELYSNGFKGEWKSDNYSVMNYFLGSEGITKIMVYDFEKCYDFYILIDNENSMSTLRKWISSLGVPVRYDKLYSII